MIRNCAIRLLLAKKKRFDGFNLFMDIAQKLTGGNANNQSALRNLP